MKFQPGQNKIQKGRTTYIRDVSPKQRIPVIKEDHPTEEIKKPKKEKDESIQHGQMVQKPVSKRSKPVRKQGRPSSKSNRSSDSGS